MTLLPARPNQSLVGPRSHVSILLDESTSMNRIRKTVVLTFNEYLDTIREQPTEVRATTTIFADAARVEASGVPLMQVPYLSEETYHPHGSTALYDALGQNIELLDKLMGERDRALVVIVTDGQDNVSQAFDQDTIAQMVRLRSATGRWTFVFLGADPSVGAALGIDHTLKLGAGAEGFAAGMVLLTEATEQYLLTDGL